MAMKVASESSLVMLRRNLEISESSGEFLNSVDRVFSERGSVVEREWLGGGVRPELDPTSTSDAENAGLVFDYLGPISRTLASDRRLWSYVTCVEFRAYSTERWPLEGERWKSRAKSRWIVTNSSRGTLLRNSLARLWWGAFLTRDEAGERRLTSASGDPLAYTKALFARQDTFLQLIDREIAMVPDLLFGILDHLSDVGRVANEAYVREMMKELVLVSGYADFASMSTASVVGHVGAVADRVQAAL